MALQVGAANVVANATALADMTTKTNRYLGAEPDKLPGTKVANPLKGAPIQDLPDVPQDKTKTTLSFAASHAKLVSKATLAAGVIISAGQIANIRRGDVVFKAEASSGNSNEGNAGLVFSIEVSEAEVRTVVNGVGHGAVRPGSLAKLVIDPLAGANQPGHVDLEDASVWIGYNALRTGDEVVYVDVATASAVRSRDWSTARPTGSSGAARTRRPRASTSRRRSSWPPPCSRPLAASTRSSANKLFADDGSIGGLILFSISLCYLPLDKQPTDIVKLFTGADVKRCRGHDPVSTTR